MENLVLLIGNLGDGPGFNYTAKEMPVAFFDIATTEGWKDKHNGEQKEAVEWNRVEVWGKLGKACADHLKKGSLVYVRGKIKTKNWETKRGKRYFKFIKAERIKFLKI